MKTKISIRLDKSPQPVRGSAEARPAITAHCSSVTGAGTGASARQARVLVVAEADFDGRTISDILRLEYAQVKLASTRDSILDRVRSERFDVLLLCSQRSSRQAMELLNQVTSENPALPVIVVTSPPVADAHEVSSPHTPLIAPPVDAALLLRSIREALTEPKVKRLIRLTGSRGEPKFIARNARWLGDNLPARYSMPFHWTPPEVVIPLRIEVAVSANSPLL
jgi:CheY-like chemotaxis protein